MCACGCVSNRYAYVGLGEEAAAALLGEGGVEVFHSSFAPLEWALSHGRTPSATAFAKVRA